MSTPEMYFLRVNKIITENQGSFPKSHKTLRETKPCPNCSFFFLVGIVSFQFYARYIFNNIQHFLSFYHIP